MPITEAPKPGIYKGVSYEDYAKWDAVRSSTLVDIEMRSAAHAKAKIDNPPEPSDAFRLGGAFHCHVLEPFEFEERYAVMPKQRIDRRTKEGKERWAAFDTETEGKIVLSRDEYEDIVYMTTALWQHKKAWGYLCHGEPEVCIVWIDPDTGLLCKARIDYVRRLGFILDVKSTRDANPKAFSRACYNYGYHIQVGHYTQGYSILTGEKTEFVFVPVEKTAPYDVVTYKASSSFIMQGVVACERSLRKYKQCTETGKWPGYSDYLELLDLPRWAQDPELQSERFML